jgi:hypothetical protein
MVSKKNKRKPIAVVVPKVTSTNQNISKKRKKTKKKPNKQNNESNANKTVVATTTIAAIEPTTSPLKEQKLETKKVKTLIGKKNLDLFLF